MKYILLLITILSFACSPVTLTEPQTLADSSDVIAGAWCDGREACGYGDAERCYRHNYSHLCELDDICSQALTDEQRAALGMCEDDLEAMDCMFLGWGFVPESCGPFF